MSYAWLLHWTITVFLLLAVVIGVRAGHVEPVGCTQLPALTGDATTAAGSCATTDNRHKISTQTASNSAAIAWTGLATYDTYEWYCKQVYGASVGDIRLQVGEGATPTWETANYQWNRNALSGGAAAASGSSSDSSIKVEGGASNAVASSGDLYGQLFNVTQTNVVKHIQYTYSADDTNVVYYINGSGAYTGDTNAVTAFRVISSSGNIYGTCTLYALVGGP